MSLRPVFSTPDKKWIDVAFVSAFLLYASCSLLTPVLIPLLPLDVPPVLFLALWLIPPQMVTTGGILLAAAKYDRDLPILQKLALNDHSRFSWKYNLNLLLFLYVLTLLLAAGMERLAHACGLTLPRQELFLFLQKASSAECMVLAFSTVILAPAAEELLFRHVLFTKLTGFLPVPVAAILQALIFSAMHLNILQAPGLFCMGLILQTAYLRERTLLAPMAIHAMVNLITVSLFLLTR